MSPSTMIRRTDTTTATSSTREYSVVFYSRASKAAALGAGSGAVVYRSKKAISTATRKKGTHHHVDTSPTGQATGEEWLIPFLAKQLFQR